MVEILGVLAIIGVLSIGGILGYNIAMNKHRTNELLDGANKRAMIVSTQLMLKLAPNLSEFNEYNETAGGTFADSVIEFDNEQFAIPVGNVRKETCVALIKSIGDKTPIRDITTQDDTDTSLTVGDCRESGNQLALIFDNELRNNADTSSSSSNGSSTSAPQASCSAYTGTSPSGAGGVAGKADDGITDCRCPANNEWDGTNGKCVDNRPLYVATNEKKTHSNWASSNMAGYCPGGYHWAGLSEFISDFNCHLVDDIYECNDFSFGGWLKDCAEDWGYTPIACNSGTFAFSVVQGAAGSTHRYINDSAVCRRD